MNISLKLLHSLVNGTREAKFHWESGKRTGESAAETETAGQLPAGLKSGDSAIRSSSE
ncbi:MAG: hypothetical protein HoeaKO_46190 [Hoeflea alexandrii]